MQIDRWIECFHLPIRMAVWLGALFVLSMLGVVANAAEVRVEWELPAERVDGTPLAATELDRTVVQHGTCGRESIAEIQGTVEAKSPAVEAVIVRGPGKFCVNAYVVDAAGQTSAPSATVAAEIASGSPPSAPLVLKLTVLPEDVGPPPPKQWRVRTSGTALERRAHPKTSSGDINSSRTAGWVAVGETCDCSVTAGPEPGAGLLCSVSGLPHFRTGEALPYPAEDGTGGAFTYCVEVK